MFLVIHTFQITRPAETFNLHFQWFTENDRQTSALEFPRSLARDFAPLEGLFLAESLQYRVF